jgi:hypothetical protein
MSFDYGAKVDYWSPIYDFAVKKRSKQGAKIICGLIAHHLENDQPLPFEIKQFLVAALRDAQKGKSLDRFFGLKGKQGIRKDPLAVWFWHERIHGQVQSLIDQGRKPQAAYKEVADLIADHWPGKYEYDENSIGRIYRETAERIARQAGATGLR